MSTELLHIDHLSKTYPSGTQALKDVNLKVTEGEFIVVIGPSGAGKSTFIRCINRMISPFDGTISFMGTPVESLSGRNLRHLRSNIGMIFQDYNLIGRTNVIRNVLHGCLGSMNFLQSLFGRYRREDVDHAAELLEQVGLKDQMYQRADQLSGGQMQRVGICRALIQHPRLMLADEPIASLDPKSAHVVMDTLFEATNNLGLTCMVNLHQVDFAKEYATRIIGIRAGSVVYDGKPENLSDDTIAHIYQGKESQMTLETEQSRALDPVPASVPSARQ